MAYTLASPIPSIVDRRAVQPGLQSYGQFVIMFITPASKVHLITHFSNQTTTYLNDINLTDNTYQSATVPIGVEILRFSYDKAAGIIYFMGGGTDNFFSYNISTGVVTTLWSFGSYGSQATILTIPNSSNIVWFITQNDGNIIKYDKSQPVSGTNPVILCTQPDVDGTPYSYAADDTYLYIGLHNGDGNWLLTIEIANPSNWDTYFKTPRLGQSVYVTTEGVIFYNLEGGTSQHRLINGVVGEAETGLVAPDISPSNNVIEDNIGNMSGTWGPNLFNCDLLLDHILPLEGTQEYSEIQYRIPDGSGDYTPVQIAFTGSYGTPDPEWAMVGLGGDGVLSGFRYLVEYNYITDTAAVYGGWVNPYSLIKMSSGLIFSMEYTGCIRKWNRALPWTATENTNGQYPFSNPPEPNPYQVTWDDHSSVATYPSDNCEDANGLLWVITSNRNAGSYGAVTWVNPANDQNGVIASVQAIIGEEGSAPSKLRCIEAGVSGTKVCFSSRTGQIYVIDAATKLVENTWTITSNPELWLTFIEVESDYLLILQASIEDNTGTVSRITKMRISTGAIIFDKAIGVAGWVFGSATATGYDDEYQRYRAGWQLLKGPDNAGYVFVGTTLYRVNPTNGDFDALSITGLDNYWQIVINNNTDLILHGSRADIKYIPGMWESDGVDTTPTQFTFTDITNAALSTVYTSNQITVAGIDAAAAISITGGTYSKNGGAYTSGAGTVVVGDTITVRVTSSGSYSTAVNAVLTIGGVTDTYTVTTGAEGPASVRANVAVGARMY